jgi:hypothetical protein
MATAYEPQPEDSPDGMSDAELATILEQHSERAVGYYETEIAHDQADALDRYYRRPYGDERLGRSQVVDGTVAITVDNALAAILKPFVSADETVVFQPKSKEDEEVAAQATEYVNYILHNDNCGFQVFHDWFKDALLQKVGVVKAYPEAYATEKPERLEGLDPMQVQRLQQEEQVIGGPYGPDEYGLYSLDIMRKNSDVKICVENIPPEEYRISPLARPGRVPPYEAHVTRKSRSELIEMGFDREVVMGLARNNNDSIDDSRAQSRYQDESWMGIQRDAVGTEANDLVDFNDEFCLVDYNGDGVSELRRVMRSGNVVLYNEEVEYGLFARLCPAPMPHKIYGLSLADQVKDEQRIATALWRQTLDNLYLSNNPRPIIGATGERDDGTTIDDLLSDAPGAIIRAQDARQLDTFSVAFVADKSFPMLSYVEQQAQSRTGISKHGQGMDPSALETAGQMTATQAAIMEDGRNSRAEMIARIFAETGVKDLFKLMLKLVIEHQPRSRMIRLRNKWVEMDPRSWNADMDVSVAVGLGMGSKAEQITTAQSVLETMERVGQTPFGSLIDKEKVYNALKKLYTAAGIKNTDDYLVEPQKDEQGNLVPDPEQPDPEQQKLQAEMEMQQAKLQAGMQAEQMKAQMKLQSDSAEAERKMQEMLAKIQLEQAKAEAKAQLEHAKAQFEAQLAEQKFNFEAALAAKEAALDDARAERDADRQDRIAEQKVSKNRAGGDLSE